MSKVKFQHKAIVTISDVAIKTIVATVTTALVGAVGLAVIAAVSDVAPKFIYDLDIMCNAM